MAKKPPKSRPARNAAKRPASHGSSGNGKDAVVYKHEEEKLLLRPDVGLQAQFRKKKAPKTYRYDPSLDPELSWDINADRERGESLIARIESAETLSGGRPGVPRRTHALPPERPARRRPRVVKPEVEQLPAKARRSLAAARRNAAADDHDFAASRAYYAMFDAAEALLLHQGLACSKHTAVISEFNRLFVQPGAIEQRHFRVLSQGLNERDSSATITFRRHFPRPRRSG